MFFKPSILTIALFPDPNQLSLHDSKQENCEVNSNGAISLNLIRSNKTLAFDKLDCKFGFIYRIWGIAKL